MRVFLRLALAISLLFLALSPRGVLADGFEEVEGKVVTHTLDNGLRVIILERHIAPVASFLTVVRVGSVNERPGITGIAHLFEHMAFKGTDTIGTTDYEKEMVAIRKVDEAYAALIKARDRGEDQEKIEALQAEFKKLQDEASQFVVGEFDEVLQVNGGAGLNASTSSDRTMYVVSLPSNRVELWAALESERFLNPVLREFYKERSVVQEERRLRTDSSPFGRFREEFISAAFRAHPYGWPVVGHMSDIQTVTREEGLEFYKKYYVASNMIVAIVGDVNPEEVIRIVEKYFGRLPKNPPPGRVETVEPPQRGERTVILEDPAQPLYAVGYHKPDAKHPDDIVFDVMSEILSSGRTSRLYKSLVKEQKIAVQVFSFSGSPGNRYPN
ncbi:MAG: pitrilysin family protein, partial [Planctomycetota bacterium]|nr:pitrilysin family protein [Planctomycetota bacterium]